MACGNPCNYALTLDSRHFSSFPLFMKEMTCLALLGKAGDARLPNALKTWRGGLFGLLFAQIDPSHFVDLDDFDLEPVANLDNLIDILHVLVRELRNMDQSLF